MSMKTLLLLDSLKTVHGFFSVYSCVCQRKVFFFPIIDMQIGQQFE
jgi:hypothetical protein